MKQKHIENLAKHALATLPDSISARKRILTDVIAALPPGELGTQSVVLLTHLTEHERAQAKLKF